MQLVKGSGVATAMTWVTAAAEIQSLAWGLPYATGLAIIKKKRKRNTLAPQTNHYPHDLFVKHLFTFHDQPLYNSKLLLTPSQRVCTLL